MFVLISIFAVLAGLAFGSFLNVCISRLPRHESIVAPRSRCPHCLTPIRNRDNIPVLSWLLLRGRCRDCAAPIAVRYPLIEATTAALFLLCLLEFGLDLRGIAASILCWLLLGLAVTDAETMLLPDALTLPGLALGVIWSGFQIVGDSLLMSRAPASDGIVGHASSANLFLAFHPKAAAESLLWAVCAAACILLIRAVYWLARRREGIGLGDAKLLAMIAAWLGPWLAALALFLGVVSAAIYGAALVVWGRRGSKKPFAPIRIPLGAFLAAAGIFAVFMGEEILKWYLSFF